MFYVGKVCDFKKCVLSYFNKMLFLLCIVMMVVKIVCIDIIVVCSEVEVLLFENNFIKVLVLCYNILFCDDKLYLYLKFMYYVYLCMVYYCGVIDCRY